MHTTNITTDLRVLNIYLSVKYKEDSSASHRVDYLWVQKLLKKWN